MNPRIETLQPTKIFGLRQSMSMAQNTTVDLWRAFRQRRDEVKNLSSTNLISLQIYPIDFNPADPTQIFVKWAGIPVNEIDEIPNGMEVFEIPQGLYAVFQHIGGPATATQTFSHIFGHWLPRSGYALDNRPHFEVLGERYKHGDPNSEEEIWIPVKKH